MADGRDNDLRCKRQRGDDDPRGHGAVVRSVWGTAGGVAEEFPLDPAYDPLHPAGAVTGCKPPAVFCVAGELQRVLHRVRLLHEGRLSAVLEVVGAVLAHEGVADTAEVDPQVREL